MHNPAVKFCAGTPLDVAQAQDVPQQLVMQV
jgi:hypothetical protein